LYAENCEISDTRQLSLPRSGRSTYTVRPIKTDRWGYPKDWKPEDTGHSDVWHPKFGQGDDPEEIQKYVGEELTEWYLS
jgi:hypothetical protein